MPGNRQVVIALAMQSDTAVSPRSDSTGAWVCPITTNAAGNSRPSSSARLASCSDASTLRAPTSLR